MKIVVFGLTISSSWGNGHATLWRGLTRALARAGHRIVFFERDVPYYAANRDLFAIEGGELVFYRDWDDVRARADRQVRDADVAIVTSYCPDALNATDLTVSSPATSVFYDLDTPVTLSRLERGEEVDYIGPRGLADFDLALSFTGGPALGALQGRLGARRAAPLYGHVDPGIYARTVPVERYRSDLSYLGTFAPDRQAVLKELFLHPAEARPDKRFVIAGAQYPQNFPWCENLFFVRHLAPNEHPAFYSSSRLTLNVTRAAMARMGWCPSGRLFEAASCGTAILSDAWDGLSEFFKPGEEILVARTREDTLAALDLGDAEIACVTKAARERVLAEHTSSHRAEQLVALLESVHTPIAASAPPPQPMRIGA